MSPDVAIEALVRTAEARWSRVRPGSGQVRPGRTRLVKVMPSETRKGQVRPREAW